MSAWAGAQSDVKLVRAKIVSVSIADRPAQWRLEVVWSGRVDVETGMVADLSRVDQAMGQLSLTGLEVMPGPRAAQALLTQLQGHVQQLASATNASVGGVAGPGLPIPSELRLISRANRFVVRA
jgi:hypothetical protein